MNDKMFDLLEQDDANGDIDGTHSSCKSYEVKDYKRNRFTSSSINQKECNMKKNIKYTKELKKLYDHTEEWRYDNPKFLFEQHKIDEIVVGYCLTEAGRYFRHSWGIKNGMLIDTSLEADRFLKLTYLPLFQINKRNFECCYNKASDYYYFDLDIQEEFWFVVGLKNLTQANFWSILNYQNQYIYYAVSGDAFIEVEEKYIGRIH